VSNESDATRFSVTYSDDEVRSYSKLMARRYARGDDDYTFFGLMMLAIFVVGLAVFGAFELGLVKAAALRSVMVTAYVAFAAGWLKLLVLSAAVFQQTPRQTVAAGTMGLLVRCGRPRLQGRNDGGAV
jgi:hypothetical protein